MKKEKKKEGKRKKKSLFSFSAEDAATCIVA